MSTALASALQCFRLRAGLSQSELARQAGTCHSYVNMIEGGVKRSQHPSRLVVTGLARVMQLDDFDTALLLVLAGHWPFDLSLEDTRVLLVIGGRITQAAIGAQEQAS